MAVLTLPEIEKILQKVTDHKPLTDMERSGLVLIRDTEKFDLTIRTSANLFLKLDEINKEHH